MSESVAFEAYRLDVKAAIAEGIHCSVFHRAPPRGDANSFTQKTFGCLPGNRIGKQPDEEADVRKNN